jgi:hypothetical protein
MAALMATLLPTQVFADSITEYVSEIKIGMGTSSDKAKKALEGYTILSDGNNPVDLNQKAGGGWGSKGEKVVYLGYKTTTDSKQAITDLALMNMKGGYDVAEYEALMETQMKSQILPFVENFFAAIEEYRENYNSDIESNRERAAYFHDALNKMTDDDCGGKGLGDLLLNETKWEMGDEAYNKLSKEEKDNTLDLVTLIAQSNGKATLIMYDLLTRSADTNDTTWIERFADITYDDLIDATGKAPTDAAQEVAKEYDDDANAILEMWDAFREQLLNADEAKEKLEEIDEDKVKEDSDILNDFDFETADDNDADALVEASVETENETELLVNHLNDFVAKEFLDTIEYGDGTMLDFFTQEYDEVADDITMLYPMVASLSPGQRAGLEYITLSTLVSTAGTTPDCYKDSEIDELDTISVYEGVDRGIYETGGVALTSDALRKKSDALALSDTSSSFPINWWTIFTAATGLLSAVAFFTSVGVKVSTVSSIKSLTSAIAANSARIKEYNVMAQNFAKDAGKLLSGNASFKWSDYNRIFYKIQNGRNELMATVSQENRALGEQVERLAQRSSTCNKLMIGFAVATIIIAGVTTYLAWRDMQAYYKVDFTPIPHYMVDEKDITGYNKKGEKIVLKNQTAYYKAVECNRTSDDEFFKVLGTCADMNGDVGQQWLALYAVKKELMEPIIASSLKVVVDSVEIPAGYSAGIHMFGTEAVFNLNSNLYDWNSGAPSVFIYYKTDSDFSETTGSNFSTGTLVLTCGAGFIAGAIVTVLAVSSKKKKEA